MAISSGAAVVWPLISTRIKAAIFLLLHTHTHSGRATQTLMQQWSGKRVKLIINAMANWRAEKEREQEQQQQEQQEQQSTTAFCAVDTLDSRIYAT